MLRLVTVTGLLFLIAGAVGAALAPRYQNGKNLDAMVEFVKERPAILAALKQIDLEHYVVRYGDDCEARFEHQSRARPPGWVGPAAPLVLKQMTCKAD